MIIMDKEKCKEEGVCESGKYGSFHPHRCRRNVWKDGWCKQHHSEEVKKREDAAELRRLQRMKDSPLGRLRICVEENKRLKKLLGRLFEAFNGQGENLTQSDIEEINSICQKFWKENWKEGR